MGWVLLVLALALRVRALGADDFWVDEAYSLQVARAPLAEVLLPGYLDFHPPAFYVLLWAWRPIFGDGEVALRLLPVLIGVASVWAIGRLADELGGRDAGLLAMLLTATARLHVTYSRELRGYGLLFLGVALLLLARAKGSRWRIAARALLAMTHLQGTLCVALEGLWDLARRAHGPRALALEYGPAALVALPYVVVSALYATEHGRVAQAAGPLAMALGLVVLFSAMTIGCGPAATALLASLAHAAPFVLGLAPRGKPLPEPVGRGLLALLALGPFAAGALVPGSLRLSGMMAPLAPVLVLSALGLAALPRPARLALVSALLASSAVALTDLYSSPIHQQWRDVAAAVRASGATPCTTDRDDALALAYHLKATVVTCDPAPHFPALAAVPRPDPAARRLAVVHAPLRGSWELVRPAGYREVESRSFPRQFPLELHVLERAPTPPPRGRR